MTKISTDFLFRPTIFGPTKKSPIYFEADVFLTDKVPYSL